MWGLCKGSGSKPYQTVVDIKGPAFKCSCPSRKFPCKHALGLLLLWAGDGREVTAGEPPQWAGEWLAGRRERAAARREHAAVGRRRLRRVRRPTRRRPGGGRSAGCSGSAPGATELEQRLEDLLRGPAWPRPSGRVTAPGTRRPPAWSTPRLPDSPRGCGSWARSPASGPGWPARLLEECALLHLLDQGFLGIERLPDAARGDGPLPGRPDHGGGGSADRPRGGDGAGPLAGPRPAGQRGRQADHPPDLAARRADRPDGAAPLLRRRPAAPRTGPAARPGARRGPRLLPGRPPAARRPGRAARPGGPGGPYHPAAASMPRLAAYGDALRDDPWLDSWPVVLAGVTPIPSRDGTAGSWPTRTASRRSRCDPRCLGRTSLWQLAAISGGAPVTVFGECGHRGFTAADRLGPGTRCPCDPDPGATAATTPRTRARRPPPMPGGRA